MRNWREGSVAAFPPSSISEEIFMKTLLRGTVAITALISMSNVAQAQTHSILNPVNESVTSSVTVSQRPNPAYNQGQNNQPEFTSNGCPANKACVDTTTTVTETSFTISGSAPDNTEQATEVVTNAFTLTGTVTKDCSFYAGNNASARTIDFGVIGVRTGNNENVGSAFEMAGDLNATINTLTAGCNFNNEVKIAKGNQWGDGMNLVGNPGGFDTTQFQTNIPYTVTAKWNGVAENALAQGSEQKLEVGLAEASDTKTQGAWRSAMNIAINAPAVSNRGLVAGTYTDTMTVTLSAL
jgi:hypothetical protein